MVFKLFRWVCYAALIIVAGAFVLMIALGSSELCSSLSTGSIRCSSPTAQTLAELSFGIVLISVFTGIPTLFALLGVVFLIRALWLRFGPELPEEDGEVSTAARIQHFGKMALYVLGGLFALAFFGGMLSAAFE
ncbi:MAG: hypothetical protein AAF441_08790 [Pseudomonadota bacterium]